LKQWHTGVSCYPCFFFVFFFDVGFGFGGSGMISRRSPGLTSSASQIRSMLASVFEPGEASIRPDAWRLTIGWQVARRLQRRVDGRAKKAGLQRRPRPNRGPYVAAVTDLMTQTSDVYTPGGLMEISGSRLKFDGAQADEGVFFRPAAGGPEVRADSYLNVFPKTIQALVPAALTGPQHLIVRRRIRPTQPTPSRGTYDTVLLPA
jgi:hypothetical protein